MADTAAQPPPPPAPVPPLSDAEVLGVRALLGAISASGVSADGIANTLKVGDLTTQMAQFDDRIAAARDAKSKAAADADNAIAGLADQRAALAAQRQALAGGK
jgi:hypothetical protein